MFQIAICVSPEPSKTIEIIMGGFTKDKWMSTFHEKLTKGALPSNLEKEFEKHKPRFDEKKLRNMINWELRLLLQLSVSEITFIYPLLTNLSRKE